MLLNRLLQTEDQDVCWNISPSPPTYLPLIKTSLINKVRMEITDQSGNKIDLNGEQVTYTLNIRPKM